MVTFTNPNGRQWEVSVRSSTDGALAVPLNWPPPGASLDPPEWTLVFKDASFGAGMPYPSPEPVENLSSEDLRAYWKLLAERNPEMRKPRPIERREVQAALQPIERYSVSHPIAFVCTVHKAGLPQLGWPGCGCGEGNGRGRSRRYEGHAISRELGLCLSRSLCSNALCDS
jgi:hypothetical protein